jgi:hypothetical protein
MAKFLCKCGHLLSNSEIPNDIQYHVYSDKEWHEKILINNNIDVLELPKPAIDVWKCPVCQRLYIFSSEGSLLKTYKLEE